MTLDETTYRALERMAVHSGSKATAMRDSLQLNYNVQLQAEEGFSRVILQNPKTGAERVLVVPNLEALAK